MSLKDKLRSLIEATFTSKKAYIAEQALPSSEVYSSITVQPSTSNAFVARMGGGFLRFIKGLLNPCKEVQYA